MYLHSRFNPTNQKPKRKLETAHLIRFLTFHVLKVKRILGLAGIIDEKQCLSNHKRHQKQLSLLEEHCS